MAEITKKASRKIKAKIHKGSKRSSIRTTKRSPKPATRVKHAKRVGMTNKKTIYSLGTPKGQTLKVAYNGIGNEFAFTLSNNSGKIGGTFHVSGNQLMNIMGIPLMVVPT
jgi:hypothetical protein